MAVSAEEDPPARMLHLCCLKRHSVVVRLCTRPFIDLTVYGIICEREEPRPEHVTSILRFQAQCSERSGF